MEWKEAAEYVKTHFPYEPNSEYCALAKIRHKAVTFPEYGAEGIRDESEWMYLDMTGKIDTGQYGDIYYFGKRKG